VNSQARVLAFIDVFWALQILGVAAIVLLLIRRFAPNAAGNAPAPAVDHASVALHT